MSETSDAMRTQSDAEQEPPVTTPPAPESVPGGPAAQDDAKDRDGGEDIRDDGNRSTAYAQAQQQQ
jgi:hypothetical protein